MFNNLNKYFNQILLSLKTKFDEKIPCNENTFIVAELCSKSHSEIVPGFCKYLLDLGYDVTAIVHPDRIKEGLFCRFKDDKLTLYPMRKKKFLKYFNKHNLGLAKGILITTAGKLLKEYDYEAAYNFFKKQNDNQKVMLVEHEIKYGIDKGTLPKNIITLRKMDYKNAETVPINPHYFGNIKITSKNDITNFVTIGKITDIKKNTNLFIDTACNLIKNNITNFKITVIGTGNIKHLPEEIKPYIDIKGHLTFSDMYNELEKADFILTAYEDKPDHIRYITTGTSGAFQLVYGFLKPVIIKDNFAPINEFNNENSILYSDDKDFYNAMVRATNLTSQEYQIIQTNLKNYVDKLYNESKNNLQNLIN
ncbi:MAG: hypothetical protein LKG27_04500 [Clostridiaceae bacterium]|jgi:hypothetical protein|nr:hypothetical protein [Clostridiaceae bacterium]